MMHSKYVHTERELRGEEKRCARCHDWERGRIVPRLRAWGGVGGVRHHDLQLVGHI
jgi:hypothetical protein